MSTLTRRTALQLNAIVGLACLVTSVAVMSLVLTQPEAAAAAVAQHHYGTVVAEVARELAGWLHALLRFL